MLEYLDQLKIMEEVKKDGSSLNKGEEDRRSHKEKIVIPVSPCELCTEQKQQV